MSSYKSLLLLSSLAFSLAFLSSCAKNKDEPSLEGNSDMTFSSLIEERSSFSSEEEEGKDSEENSDMASSGAYSHEEVSASVDISYDDIDEGEGLFVFGELYAGLSRDIYLRLDGEEHAVIWASSDPSIISVSPIGEETSTGKALKKNNFVFMASMRGKNKGSATITATVDGETSYSKEIPCLGEGIILSEEAFDSILYGMAIDAGIAESDFGIDLTDPLLDQQEQIVTIYEENNPESKNVVETYSTFDLINRNTTDCYYLKEKKAGGKEYAYYRSNGNKVGEEYVDIENKVAVKPLVDEEGDAYAWERSYYLNLFNSDGIEREDFRSFDGGKTYVYVGGYVGSMNIAISLTLRDLVPDLLSLKVEENAVTEIDFELDPIINDSDYHFYGLRYAGLVSDINTAKAPHLSPRETLAYHQTIQEAIEELGHNYTAATSIVYEDGDYMSERWVYEEGNVDLLSTDFQGNVTHLGYHQGKENEFSSYSYDEEKGLVKFLDAYEGTLEDHGWYPSFAFASEIFVEDGTLSYKASEGCDIAAYYCATLGKAFNAAAFSDMRLFLNADDSLKRIAFSADLLGAIKAKVTINYSSIGSSSCGIDFTKIDEEADPLPSSWGEDPSSVYATLEEDYFLDSFPYLYCPVGYKSAHQRQASSSLTGCWCFMVETGNFPTREEGYAWIDSYIEMLLDLGYADTGVRYKGDDDNEVVLYQLPDSLKQERGLSTNEYICLDLSKASYSYGDKVVGIYSYQASSPSIIA